MTALSMDVRELTFDEIDSVSGGWRTAAARWIINAVASGMAYEAAVAAWNYMMANPMEGHDSPRPVSYGV